MRLLLVSTHSTFMKGEKVKINTHIDWLGFSLFFGSLFTHLSKIEKFYLCTMSGMYELINMPTRAQESKKKLTQWLRINSIKMCEKIGKKLLPCVS